ncbi:MAG TPA: hypothetical protein VK915_00765 [Gaiellaceae bacterium]|nr:hypothetical protein [Gaiellaceae bacterium]
MAEKTDYSPVRERAPAPEQKRERRLTKAFVLGAHAFWLYALVVAGVIALLIWLLGGFDAGGR